MGFVARSTSVIHPSNLVRCFELLFEQHDLSQMVAVVVSGDEDFAEEALAVSPGDGGIEVLGWIHDHLLELQRDRRAAL